MPQSLKTSAPIIVAKQATSNGRLPFITRGFKQGQLLLHPVNNFKYTDWNLMTIDSGLILATFSYENLALGKAVLLLASKLDWRGSVQSKINPSTIKEWKSIIEFLDLSV